MHFLQSCLPGKVHIRLVHGIIFLVWVGYRRTWANWFHIRQAAGLESPRAERLNHQYDYLVRPVGLHRDGHWLVFEWDNNAKVWHMEDRFIL